MQQIYGWFHIKHNNLKFNIIPRAENQSLSCIAPPVLYYSID